MTSTLRGRDTFVAERLQGLERDRVQSHRSNLYLFGPCTHVVVVADTRDVIEITEIPDFVTSVRKGVMAKVRSSRMRGSPGSTTRR